MRLTFVIAALLIAATLSGPETLAQQAPAPTAAGTTMTVEALAQKIMEAESGITARMSAFKPLVEVYVQYVEPHAQLGTVPIKDDYFLGQFESSPAGPRINSFTRREGRAAPAVCVDAQARRLRRHDGARLAAAEPQALRFHVPAA